MYIINFIYQYIEIAKFIIISSFVAFIFIQRTDP